MSTSGVKWRIAIIGTGFSGLCMGIHLKKIGLDSFVIFEKAKGVGGTWRENTYPGAECDIPSPLYSFSFERNPRWTHKWSEQPEILRYLEHCADKYGLRPHIRFGEEIADLKFEEERSEWRIETRSGSVEHFDAVVSGVGQLHKPVTPKFEGAESFAGPSFHSARWDHSVPLEGKRVAVIGNAASAVQFIPQIAPKVSRLTVFQRTPNWIVPKNDREFFAFEKWLGTKIPALTLLYRFYIWLQGDGILYPLMTHQGMGWYRRLMQKRTLDYINAKIRDPELRRKLVPDYPMGAKRILFSDDFYAALDRENVEVVTNSIARIEPAGVATSDGRVHDAEVLIYATGFDSTTFLTPMRVTGRGGQVLNDLWERDGAEAYLGITHAGFPNFFMMYGPNTNLGHNSIVIMIESQTRYILSCLRALEARQAKWLDVKADAQKNYNAWIQSRMSNKIWSAVDKSWYKRDGKVTNNWVGRTTEYIRRTRKLNEADYSFG